MNAKRSILSPTCNVINLLQICKSDGNGEEGFTCIRQKVAEAVCVECNVAEEE